MSLFLIWYLLVLILRHVKILFVPPQSVFYLPYPVSNIHYHTTILVCKPHHGILLIFPSSFFSQNVNDYELQAILHKRHLIKASIVTQAKKRQKSCLFLPFPMCATCHTLNFFYLTIQSLLRKKFSSHNCFDNFNFPASTHIPVLIKMNVRRNYVTNV
jgi:hypothetical protein